MSLCELFIVYFIINTHDHFRYEKRRLMELPIISIRNKNVMGNLSKRLIELIEILACNKMTWNNCIFRSHKNHSSRHNVTRKLVFAVNIEIVWSVGNLLVPMASLGCAVLGFKVVVVRIHCFDMVAVPSVVQCLCGYATVMPLFLYECILYNIRCY